MINLLSALTAIAVYSRLCELGHAGAAAVVCGVLTGALARWAFKTIKKPAEAAASSGQENTTYTV